MAIRMASDRILATVEAIGKLKQGQYGDFRSVLLQRSDIDGEGGKVWKSMKPSDAAKFTRGMQCWLIPTKRDGRDTFDVEIADPSAPLPSAAPAKPAAKPEPASEHHQPLTPVQKRAIALYIAERSDLLGFCFETVHQRLAVLDGTAQTAAAIELYRSTARKFEL